MSFKGEEWRMPVRSSLSTYLSRHSQFFDAWELLGFCRYHIYECEVIIDQFELENHEKDCL